MMSISADAIMFGLRMIQQGVVSPGGLADLLADIPPRAPDQWAAVQEAVLARFPGRATQMLAAAEGTPFVPVRCPGCRTAFRVRPDGIGRNPVCPLCEEPIRSGAHMLMFRRTPAGAGRAAEAPSEFTVGGERFAHFDLVELVGRGGAGRVYRARNRRTGRTVALKVLHFQPTEPAALAFERLRHEAQVAAAVEHENVVRILDLGVAEDSPFIEMAFVEGTSLRQMLRRQGAMPVPEGCRLVLQALRGLQAVHRAGIVHGDVKPGNILVDPHGAARLTDFGLAKFLEETTTVDSGGKLVGSPHFMAPEQWRGEQLSPRTDLYAMGLVLYNLLTGRFPYEGDSPLALMYKHLHEPLLEPGADNYPLPGFLAQVIRRASEKEPQERFGSATSFAEALAHYLAGYSPD